MIQDEQDCNRRSRIGFMRSGISCRMNRIGCVSRTGNRTSKIDYRTSRIGYKSRQDQKHRVSN